MRSALVTFANNFYGYDYSHTMRRDMCPLAFNIRIVTGRRKMRARKMRERRNARMENARVDQSAPDFRAGKCETNKYGQLKSY